MSGIFIDMFTLRNGQDYFYLSDLLFVNVFPVPHIKGGLV